MLDAEGGGDLPPLVFIHGFSAAAVHYIPLFRRLRRHTRRVIALDLPGHGFSDLPVEGLHTDTLRDGLIEALDQLVTEPSVFIGNSLGGMAALRYAIDRPEQVDSLVLISPGGAPMEHHELQDFIESFAMPSHGHALDFVERLFDRSILARHVLAAGVRERFRRGPMQDLIRSIRQEHLLEADEVRGLKARTLLLWGKSERILPERGLTFFRDNLPADSSVIEPVGWGHSPYLDRPTEVADEVLRFLTAVKQAA